MKFQYNLGDRAKDRISGLTGIIVSRAEHLFGCARYWIAPEDTKDGKPQEGAWLDEASVEVVKAGAVVAATYRLVEAEEHAAPRMQRAGGPSNQPASHSRGASR
jgi:hypothetical protein